MKRPLLISLNLLLLLALALANRTNPALGLTPGQAKVVQVLDGDTLQINQNGKLDTVRLIGVDTPETHHPKKPVQCFAVTASDFAKSVAQNQMVRLVADPQGSDRDKYKRLLRYAYLPDGRLLNSLLIQEGYGFAYTVFPYTKRPEFVGVEAQARMLGKGLWTACKIDETTKVKQTQF